MTDQPNSGEHQETVEGIPQPWERQWARAWQAPFLHALSSLPDVSSACRVAGMGRTAVYAARAAQADFSDAWDECLETARDQVQSRAYEWITSGVPVKSVRTVTKTKKGPGGEVLETNTETVETHSAERSATLMIFWLKAWYGDRYRWSEKVEATGADGGPIRVESIEEIDRKIADLSAELAAKAAGAPVPVE